MLSTHMGRKKKRRIFVGDLQGCRDELEALLEAAAFDPGTDEVHPVGDLVNRGPDSLGVLRVARELDFGGVLGNHDLHLLAAAAGTREPKARDTLDAVLAAPDRDELLDWLAARPFLRVWDDVYLVHAGLHPHWDDERKVRAALEGADPRAPSPDARFAVSVRTCDHAGEALPPVDDADTRYVPWFEHYEPAAHGGRTVVFGHWSVRGLVREPHLRGLDTGCVWGKELSAWIPEEDRIVSVPAARAYSPIV